MYRQFIETSKLELFSALGFVRFVKTCQKDYLGIPNSGEGMRKMYKPSPVSMISFRSIISLSCDVFMSASLNCFVHDMLIL